ncbi:RNA polymerase sigma factor [Bernardetia sp.]|uniref:RNA polymerase sigma factor n=1 Tax=Bernardetia sp. TaxID=1937974 RepID=UPI0025BB2958|nr:sigma-70 family RNA polymerase sigma factor [Bernardetia sp.]
MSLKNITLKELCVLYSDATCEKERQRYSGSIFVHLQSIKSQAKAYLLTGHLDTFYLEAEFEDIFIDTVKAFFENLDKKGEDITNAEGLFFRIYKNKGIDLFRKEEKRRNTTSSLENSDNENSSSNEHFLNGKAKENYEREEQNENSESELNLVLELCCSLLNEKKREATYLHYYAEMAQKEVAENLNISLSAVKERCREGRKQTLLFLKNYKENRESYSEFNFTQKQKNLLSASSFFNDITIFDCQNIEKVFEKATLILQKEDLKHFLRWLFKNSFFSKIPNKITARWANALYFWKNNFYKKEIPVKS